MGFEKVAEELDVELPSRFELIVRGPSRTESDLAAVSVLRENGDVRGVEVSGIGVPGEWYIELPALLCRRGVDRIVLRAWGWWIGEGSPPADVRIVDHIACHLPGPLTGTEAARMGEAFVGMRGAYESGETGDEGVVAWHTMDAGKPERDEIEAARRAGCELGSPSIAPWVTGARASGIEVEAYARVVS